MRKTVYTLASIGRMGRETPIMDYDRRSDALRARDDLTEQNRNRMEEVYFVHDGDDEQEWDDEAYCFGCHDVRVKVGQTCAECVSQQASYYIPDEGGEHG